VVAIGSLVLRKNVLARPPPQSQPPIASAPKKEKARHC
jgi:hypothetical protein